jgi:LacI family transcriptional regulator
MAMKSVNPDPASPKVTIEDIARLAQVGRGTVSRVLNNHPAVSDETRAHVQAVIDRLHYSPNYSARHMRTESSNLIGFVTDEVITTPYAVDMIVGAQAALSEQGKIMLVVNAGYDAETTRSSIETLLERRVEGIIYAAMFHRGVQLPPRMSQLPLVLANCYALDHSLPSVVPDEVSGGYNATRALLERGHQRIAFINLGTPEPPRLPPIAAAEGRLKGYRKALAEWDIPYDDSLLRYTGQSPMDTYAITLELMQIPNPPTAFFCGNDRTAMGCYSALASLGLRIPADVAVIGFDNLTLIAETLYPALSTVQLPHHAMGRWAVEYLLQQDGAPLMPIQHQLECELVLRDSI